MIKRISVVAALALGLMGCSAFDTDGGNENFFANDVRGSIGAMQTSNKLAEPKEMAGMEELAATTEDISRMFQMNVPVGFDRISNMTSETSDFNFRTSFQAGLANCDMLSRTEPDAASDVKTYWIKGGEFCDFEMSGSMISTSKRLAANVTRAKSIEYMEFSRVEGSDNPVVSLSMTIKSARQTTGQRGVGQTRTTATESTIVMTATLEDGRTFQLMALGADTETRSQIADDTRYDNVSRTQEFMAAGEMPSANMTYQWMKQSQTDEKTVETLRINGLLVALD